MSVSMKYSKRGGEPLVVIDVLMVNDIYRLAKHLQRGQSEFCEIGNQMLDTLRAGGGEEWFARVCSFFGDAVPPVRVPEDFL